MSESNEPPVGNASIDYMKVTTEERHLIMPFRHEYEHEYNRAARIGFLKDKICAAVFNLWKSRGIYAATEQLFDQKVEVINNYVRNNWRRPRKINTNTKGAVTVRIHDLIWERMPAKVERRIQELANSDTAIATNDDRFLQYFNTAIQDVRKTLSPGEVAQLKSIKEERQKIGNPPEKQNKIYQRDGPIRARRAASQLWMEMGMVQFALGAVRINGQWELEIYDQAAQHMEVNRRISFRQMWPKVVDDLEQKYLQYLRYLYDLGHPTEPRTEPNIKDRPDLKVDHDTVSGLPIMPGPPPPDVYQLTKDLGTIIRLYLNSHYRLASGHLYQTAPYTAIIERTAEFIDPEYLPPGFEFKDPNYMNREQMLAFILHVRSRQGGSDYESAFRFKAYFKEKNGFMPALYNTSNADAVATKIAEKQQARQKGKKKKGKKGPRRRTENNNDGGTEIAVGASGTMETDMTPDPEMNLWHGFGNQEHFAPEVQGFPEIPEGNKNVAPPSLPPRPKPKPRTPPKAQKENQAPEYVEIDETTYQRMRQVQEGLILTSINGPADGLPRYQVTRNLWELYISQDSTTTGSPAVLPPPPMQMSAATTYTWITQPSELCNIGTVPEPMQQINTMHGPGTASAPHVQVTETTFNHGRGTDNAPQVQVTQNTHNNGMGTDNEPHAHFTPNTHINGRGTDNEPHVQVTQNTHNDGMGTDTAPQVQVTQNTHNDGMGTDNAPQVQVTQNTHNHGMGTDYAPHAHFTPNTHNNGGGNDNAPQLQVTQNSHNNGMGTDNAPHVQVTQNTHNDGMGTDNAPHAHFTQNTHNNGRGTVPTPGKRTSVPSRGKKRGADDIAAEEAAELTANAGGVRKRKKRTRDA
ncbi:hypothetical protein BDN70DRAFT_901731 [Pholiota conissans]|uniref:Uncharacterized protein n=1 Tax=Pholiota conissans TaxID=109636 RepID=A0A9P6CSV2_9AGAR|nr:hypothetical protein BDN70DRAFT_901731 [Pholiota conissans]